MVLERVRSGMGSVRIPGHYDQVFKDECLFSFDTPESAGGLYINLNTFQVRMLPYSRQCDTQVLK